MVRGTYFPWPREIYSQRRGTWACGVGGGEIGYRHTSLGKESAEAMVGVSRLALLSEVSIGLDLIVRINWSIEDSVGHT